MRRRARSVLLAAGLIACLTVSVPVSEAQFRNRPGDCAECFDQEVDRWFRFMNWVDPKGERIKA